MRWLALLVLALPLTACGGVSLGTKVARAADKTVAKGSEHVTLAGTVVAAGQTVRMNGDGDYENTPALGRMHFTMSIGGKQISLDEIAQGSTIYMRSPAFAAVLPTGKSWASINLETAGKKLGTSLNLATPKNPADTLKALESAGSVSKVGDETIDGISTTHYRATVDPKKLPKDATTTTLKTIPVDVWIDQDGLLRRLTLHYATTTLAMSFSKYGEAVNVQVPSAAETADMTKLGGTP